MQPLSGAYPNKNRLERPQDTDMFSAVGVMDTLTHTQAFTPCDSVRASQNKNSGGSALEGRANPNKNSIGKFGTDLWASFLLGFFSSMSGYHLLWEKRTGE